MARNIIYLLCMNDEAFLLYEQSVGKLLESDCFDFMVYRFVDENRSYQTDIDIWSVEVEINEDIYSALHLNLCKKLKPVPKTNL
ncbi:MAG: hypothetical protein AAGC64_01205 [Bacteroidota bacterium]